MTDDDLITFLRTSTSASLNKIAANRIDGLLARIEILDEALEKMKRSRDRYREAWESEKQRFTTAMAVNDEDDHE